jgi:hypothetical protein
MGVVPNSITHPDPQYLFTQQAIESSIALPRTVVLVTSGNFLNEHTTKQNFIFLKVVSLLCRPSPSCVFFSRCHSILCLSRSGSWASSRRSSPSRKAENLGVFDLQSTINLQFQKISAFLACGIQAYFLALIGRSFSFAIGLNHVSDRQDWRQTQGSLVTKDRSVQCASDLKTHYDSVRGKTGAWIRNEK